MKFKQTVAMMLVLLALVAVPAFALNVAQAQTALPESCLSQLDFFYACQNSDWRPPSEDMPAEGSRLNKVDSLPAACLSRLDYLYACQNSDWRPPISPVGAGMFPYGLP